MTSRRAQRAAEAVREVVSTAILLELKDPRVRGVTVTHVEMGDDLRQAKVYVSIMGDEASQKLTLHGLRSAAGFLQTRIANRIQTRYTPVLRFVLDQGVKKSIAMSQLISEVLADSSAPAKPTPDEADQGIDSD
jgi:ribosome-binding factor A